MKKLLKIVLLVTVLGAFAYTIFFLYQKSQAKPVIYETIQPVRTNIVRKTVATGSVVPRKEIEIKSKVSGIIEEIYVTEGDYIRKGDLIARVQIIPDMVILNNAESRVNRARITLDDARRNHSRQKELFDQTVISRSAFEASELQLNNAIEELAAAENNLELIKKGQTKQSGATANTLIRSTIDGMVLDIQVEIGNSVIESNNFNSGTTIALVADMGEMIFEGKVDESEVGKIREGMDLILTIGAISDVKFHATLEHISPKGVEENGAIQFRIRAAVALIDSVFVRAGYSANADIVLEKKDSVLAINEKVLIFEKDSVYVEIANGTHEFEKRKIQTGLSDGINIEIVAGLTMDDKIKVMN
jgi:HlyD family secretion protein